MDDSKSNRRQWRCSDALSVVFEQKALILDALPMTWDLCWIATSVNLLFPFMEAFQEFKYVK